MVRCANSLYLLFVQKLFTFLHLLPFFRASVLEPYLHIEGHIKQQSRAQIISIQL